MATQTQSAFTILRRKQVEARTGLSRSSLYAYISAGIFPSQVALGARAVGWLDSEIDAWLGARISSKTDAEIRALVLKLEAARILSA